ncbi:MAG: MerR family transcriptional regulator [Clostridium sp.]
MSYKIKEVAELVGISVRTLHHYDEIGLLEPEKTSPAGYRLYTDKNLEKLQQILFFKELDFSLKEIKEILENPKYNRKIALEGQRELLIEKKKRLERIIMAVDESLGSIEGGVKMGKKEMFKSFDMKEINDTKKKYEKEVKEKYGSTDAYKEYENKTSCYGDDKWAKIMEDGQGIFNNLAALMDRDVADSEVQAQVEQWRNHITNNFYNCTKEILAGLGQMYVYDERFKNNIDKTKEGLAEFLSKAIEVYCNR